MERNMIARDLLPALISLCGITWRQNVEEFDKNYQNIDRAMESLARRATQFQSAVARIKESCIQ
jgi:hypothetical protein